MRRDLQGWLICDTRASRFRCFWQLEARHTRRMLVLWGSGALVGTQFFGIFAGRLPRMIGFRTKVRWSHPKSLLNSSFVLSLSPLWRCCMRWPPVNYCLNFSQKFSGLTNMVTCPGVGEAVDFPQVLAVTTPVCITALVESPFTSSQEKSVPCGSHTT